MYDMNLFLVLDNTKTDTTSSVKPLVPHAADSNDAPAHQYDTIVIGHDLRMNESPPYAVP